jgi:hypothetical protein
MRSLNTRHAVVTRDPGSMEASRLGYKAQPVSAVRETVTVFVRTIWNTPVHCGQNVEF